MKTADGKKAKRNPKKQSHLETHSHAALPPPRLLAVHLREAGEVFGQLCRAGVNIAFPARDAAARRAAEWPVLQMHRHPGHRPFSRILDHCQHSTILSSLSSEVFFLSAVMKWSALVLLAGVLGQASGLEGESLGCRRGELPWLIYADPAQFRAGEPTGTLWVGKHADLERMRPLYRISLVSARQHQRQGICVHLWGALQHDDCITGMVMQGSAFPPPSAGQGLVPL